MAIKRTSSNSLVNAPKMSTGFSSAAIPNAPTIGTATATSDVAATVEYTAAVLGATGTTFTATSNPSSITGTGSSPITVTGLTASTSYTFTVTAGNANGTSAASSTSNSITTSAPLAISGYTAIATAVVTSGGTSNITFSDIPTGYSNLEIRFTAKTSRTGNSADELVMQFNADTTAANYSYQRLFGGQGGNAYDETQGGFALLGLANSNTSNSQYFGQGVATIPDYASALPKKKAVTSLGHVTHQTNTGLNYMTNGLYFGTSPITEIKIISGSSATILEHSRFTLYGIL